MRVRVVPILMMVGCIGWAEQGGAEGAFGTWKIVPKLSSGALPRSLVVRFQPHSKGEVFTLDQTGDDGLAKTSSTILYFDGKPRDLQDFDCSGTQVSRRLDDRTVEIVRTCSGGGWTRFVRRLSTKRKELVIEITEQQPGGRREEQRLVMARQ